MAVRVYSKPVSRLLARYYRGPNHPSKLRVWNHLRRLSQWRRLQIPYNRDLTITVDERDWLQHQVLLQGFYEREVWQALARFAEQDEIVWDIGANIGCFSLLASQHAAVGQVIAFEPHPRIHELLQFHIASNNARIHPERLALSSSPGEGMLFPGPDINCGMTSMVAAESAGGITVKCSTIDHLIFEEGRSGPTLVKLDVEGFEREVLLGGQRLLRERPPKAIVFECDFKAPDRPADEGLVKLLEENSYQITHLRRPSGEVEEKENFLATRDSVPAHRP